MFSATYQRPNWSSINHKSNYVFGQQIKRDQQESMKTIWADFWGLVSTDRGSIGDSICFEKYTILREFSRQITRCDNSCSGFLYHAYSHLESEYVKYPFETVHIIQDRKVLQRTVWILCSPPLLSEYTNKLIVRFPQ